MNSEFAAYEDDTTYAVVVPSPANSYVSILTAPPAAPFCA